MQISLNGTIFASYDGKANKTSKDSKNSFDETLESENQQSYQTNIQLSPTSVNTTFKDPTNDKLVIVSLENSTIEKLQNEFGKDSVLKDENENISLTGKAQDFVAGWFADIAYTRDFLKADINNDGVLNEFEYFNTKNGFGENQEIIFGKKTLEVVDKVNVNYLKSSSQYNVYRNKDSINSLDDELNYTINSDKNFDGNISLKEYYQNEGDIKQKVIDEIKANWVTSKYFEKTPTNIAEGLAYNYFSKALNYALEILDKKEEINESSWEEIRRENHLTYDEKNNVLRLDLGSIQREAMVRKKKKKTDLATPLSELLSNSNINNTQTTKDINLSSNSTKNSLDSSFVEDLLYFANMESSSEVNSK